LPMTQDEARLPKSAKKGKQQQSPTQVFANVFIETSSLGEGGTPRKFRGETARNVKRVGEALEQPGGLSCEDFVAQVRKRRSPRGRLTAADVQHLRAEFVRVAPALMASDEEQRRIEREIAILVEGAFRMSPADVDLIWSTAPPRMPGRLTSAAPAVGALTV
jgi:hypothetical protein